MTPIRFLAIEAVETCPMACVTCPTGRGELVGRRMLQPEQLSAILKVMQPHLAKGVHIYLYHWGEPLLNPRLDELCAIAEPYGRVGISTTGCFVKADVEKCAPFVGEWIVSTSGHTEPVYQSTHPKGTAKKAHDFMVRLAAANPRNVTVVYLRYRNNLDCEELEERRFVRRLGFKFAPQWAYMNSVEAFFEKMEFPHLVVPQARQLEVAQYERERHCIYIDEALELSCEGEVQLCANSSDMHVFGNIFQEPLSDIMARKAAFPKCLQCQKTGVYKVVCGTSETVEREAIRTTGNRLTHWAHYGQRRIWKWWHKL